MYWDGMGLRKFTADEFACKCGECGGRMEMRLDFMSSLQQIRTYLGIPMVITSGFRCELHSAEKKKAKPGSHRQGRAADIVVPSSNRFDLVYAAMDFGMVGVGISDTGFVHLDNGHEHWPRPAIWSY
jgi:zinc D-Ala-D-Ala carboxypeptidase